MRKSKQFLAVLLSIAILFTQFNGVEAKASTNSSQDISSYASEGSIADTSNANVIINFSTGGGSLSDYSKTVQLGTVYGTLPTPILEGYTFDGWYTQTEGGTKVTEVSIVDQSETQTLYARWKAIASVINFNANGGTITEDKKQVLYGQEYGTMPIPVLEGYTFKGWYTLPSGGELVTSNNTVNITSSTMLYAQWVGTPVVITLESNGGSLSESVKHAFYGDEYGTLPTPTKEGFIFDGWYLLEGGSAITENSMIGTNKDHTLYAQWSQRGYTLTFNANGGSVATPSKSILSGDIYGSLPTPTLKGYTFLGWFTSPYTEEKQVTSSDIYTANSSQTLYAHWRANQYMVHLEGNGAILSASEITVTYNNTYGELPAPTLVNYTFDGWYTSASLGTQVKATTIVKLTSDETLYAQFTGNEQTVYFDANGGSSNTNNKQVYYGRNYGVLPNPVRTGYTFEGWYPSLYSTDEIIQDDTVRLTTSQTLYAHWTVKKPEITFDGNGGNVIINGESDSSLVTNLTYGDTYGTLPSVSRDGYNFDGWYTSSTGGTPVTSDTVINATVSATIYAHWSGKVYPVVLNANGGSASLTSLYVTYGDTYAGIPSPSKENYTFDGWYTALNGGNKISSSTTVKILGGQTLYAHWSGVSSRLYLNTNGGSSAITSILVNYNEAYGALPVPTLTGYKFLGWYTETAGGAEIKDTTLVTATYDHYAYAHWEVNKPVITFDANGGSVSVSSKSTVYGQNYGALPTPTRPGYNFTGWYTATISTNQITENSIVQTATDDILYAHWLGNTYTVFFNANGGSVAVSSIQVTNGTTYGTLKSPTRTGYAFGGWYTLQSGGTRINAGSIADMAGSYTLYAHWTREVYTLTFNSNGGNVEPDNTSIKIGTTYSDFPIPTKVGYTFDGWYSTASSSGSRVTYVSSARTIYAHWTANIYTVNFDANGGYVSTPSMNVVFGGTCGVMPTPTRANYAFAGWFTLPVGGGIRLASTIITVDGTQTYYAHWKGVSIKVSYDSNGGNAITASKTVTSDEAYGLLSTPTRTGYSFDGWYTSPTGGDLITAESTVNTIYDQTLYAHWSIYTPTIIYNANGGHVIENGLKVPSMKVVRSYGEAYGTLPATSRTGYTFDGWYNSSTGSSKIYEGSIITAITSDTIYAHWIGNTYTVQFDANGGSVAQNSQTVVYGSTYGTLPAPVLDGYSFQGWYTKTAGGIKVTAASVVDILGTQILYAQWKEATISVTFNGTGGTMTINDSSVSTTTRALTYGGTYGDSSGMIPAPAKGGYIFDGWYTQEAGGDEIAFHNTINVTSAQKLYAHWVEEKISVLFDENDGDPLATSKEVAYGATYGALPTPTRYNYTFNGWYTTETGNVQVTDTTVMNKLSQHTLYAHWTPLSYQISFDANGGSVSITSLIAAFEGTYGTLPTPTRVNDTFIGWFTEKSGGTKINFGNIVKSSSNTTLYAHWQEGTYQVTFNPNGGSVTVGNKLVMNNQPYGSLPVPTRTGYHFVGWYTDMAAGSRISAASIATITSAQTLYARWSPKTPTIVFYANGGNVSIVTKTATYGGTYGELPTPTKAHYTFNGWYTSLAGTEQVTASSSFNQVNSQILYAHWTADTYTVTYDANGGTVAMGSKEVAYEKAYGSLPVPTWTNHEFFGWYTSATGGNLIDSASHVSTTTNHTLYAHWRGASLEVSFHANGGEVPVTTKTVYENETYGELPVPTREGYFFAGWYTGLEDGTKITTSDTVLTYVSFTVYARWLEGGVVTETEDEILNEYLDVYLTDSIYPELLDRGWNINSIDDISMQDDYDNDGLTLEQEYSFDTNPFYSDTDEDGLTDYQEINSYKTNPLSYDTDADGMSDGTEISCGLNPLSIDTDGDGIVDSQEITTQTANLEIFDPIDINQTQVKPSIDLTGKGDYNGLIYAEVVTDNPAINEMGCVVGNAFEFLHDDNLTFESSTLTFTISDSILQTTPLEDLAIAYYNYNTNSLELLNTTYAVSGSAISIGSVSGSAITVNSVTGSAITCNTISANVDHYSTYMVINVKKYLQDLGIKDDSQKISNPTIYINLNLHSVKPSYMIVNKSDCFIDKHFMKYPYCTLNSKGSYVLQCERWLSDLGLISKINGVYEKEDIKAVAYIQQQCNLSTTGIIDNKTYWNIWALFSLKHHEDKTTVNLRLQQEGHNPDYTSDYYSYYYSQLLNYCQGGVEIFETLLALYPQGDAFDIAVLMRDLANYKKGDRPKIVADLVALGIDGAGEYADEIIDVVRHAKVKVAVLKKTVAEAVNEAGGYERALSLSTRFLNKLDPLWENAGKIKPIEGYQDIICHGDKYGFVWKNADGIESTVSAKEFADILKSSPVYSGGPIRLISCETGADGAIAAEYVAKYLGVEVMAPTDIVYVYSDGAMKIGINNTGTWKIFQP